ncbi:MAG: ATP-binding protein [Vicinamibacterales bacterium]
MPFGRHAHIPIAGTAVKQVAGALDAFCAAEALPYEVAWRLRVVLDEIVANVVTYASRGPGPAAMDVWFSRQDNLVEISVADDGPAFDPLARPLPDVTLPLEQRPVGGLGIALIRSLMDDVKYERTTRNILTIRKRIEPAGRDGEAGGHADPAQHS